MKILFVYGGYESLGIEILSSVLKENGIETDLEYFPLLFNDGLVDSKKISSFFFHENSHIKNIIKKNPDLIAFSSLTDTYDWNLKLAEKIKKIKNIPIIFGNIHASTLPEKVLKNDFIDYVCIGEGEKAIVDLCKELKKGNNYPEINNIYYKKNGKIVKNELNPLLNDLNTLPFPDKDLFYEKAPYFKDFYTIITSRNCPYNCFFCNNNVYRNLYKTNKIFRRRSVENTIEELISGLKKYDYKFVIFEDDAFVSDKKWSEKFFRLYKKYIDKPFMCLINPKNIDEDIAKWLKKSKCMNVEIGIQSMEKHIRKNILNRNESIDQIKSCIKALNKYNVSFNIDHIGGIPEEGHNNIIKTFKDYLKWKPNRITYFYLTYYPGTRITEIAQEKKYISNKELKHIENGTSNSFEHGGNVNNKEVRFHNSIRFIGDWGVFFPEFFIKILNNKKLFNLLPQNHFISRILPAVLNILTGREIRGLYILKKYFFHLIRGGF